VQTARNAGLETIVNLIFSISPKHTDEYYARKAREAAAVNPERICLKDPGGLLTPARTLTLVPAILQNVSGIPVELHTHCNTGLGPLCCLEAIKLGIHSLNTAIPPLSDGSSNPSLFNVARNARILGFTPVVDEKSLAPVENELIALARRQGWPVGVPAPYDSFHYVHQVPGGMISNLRHQLAKVGLQGRLDEVLEETARVRADFGYPIMVTPYSQFVGSQATMNVIVGERYKQVSDEVIQYALGLWGEDECSSMDANLRDRLAAMPRAKELGRRQPPQPSIEEVRRKFGAGISDDELLLRFLAGEEEVAAMRAAPRPEPHVGPRHPVSHLIGELAKHTQCSYIEVQRGPLSLTLQKASGLS